MKTGCFLLLLVALNSWIPCSCGSPPPEGASQTAPTERTDRAALQGRILFQSRVDGRWQIFLLDLASRARTRLSRSAGDDIYPNFSPPGDWIVFESARDGVPAIYRMRSDGGATERLTTGEEGCHSPCWGPGGARIAYDCKRRSGEEIYVLDLATRRETQITDSLWRSILPHWSPDGSRIAFTRNELGWDVFGMNADGSAIRTLTTEGGNCRPDWSPDGKRIAYVSDAEDGKGDIWAMDADGGNKQRLTQDSGSYDYDPSWSPDGTWIVYQTTVDKKKGPWSLAAIPASGGTPVRLSPEGADDRFPDWGP